MIRYFHNLFGQLPESIRFERPVSIWRKLWDHWITWGWVPIAVSFAWYHLLRSERTGKFIIVFSFSNPRIEGYYIVTDHWTRWGAKRGARRACGWDEFVDGLGGRVAMCRMLFGRDPVYPETEREKNIRILSREPENLLP